MSVRHGISRNPLLQGSEGELISVQVAVDPKTLEELLESLASLSFPVNPQIYHGVPTRVEFPAWKGRLSEIQHVLKNAGFDPDGVEICDMLETIGH